MPGTTEGVYELPPARRPAVGAPAWPSRRAAERRCFTCLTLTADEAPPDPWTKENGGSGRSDLYTQGGAGGGPRGTVVSQRATGSAALPLSMVGAGRSAQRSMARAARLSVRRAGRKAGRRPRLFGSGGAVRAAGRSGHGGPQVLPLDLGAVPLPQPSAEGASGEPGAELPARGLSPLRGSGGGGS